MSNTAKILLAEDDPNLGTVLCEYLQAKGFPVDLHRDGEAALSAWQSSRCDIAILDVMMPKMDGFTLAREIRKQDEKTPILFLTAKSMIVDKVEAFTIGGDDYLTKPFNMEELLMRIRALLKRSQGATLNETQDQNEFTLGKFHFKYPTRELIQNEVSQRLTTREAELLKLLCLSKNDILKREIALKLIWGDDSYFNGRSMDVFITRLRKYLRPDNRIEIMNVHGTGYKLITP